MASLVIAKAEESLPTSDFQLLTWLLHLTFLTLQISVRPPTSDFRLLTFDFQLPTSDFSLFTTFHFPAQNGLVSCCLRAGIDFLGNRANHDGELDISCYRNILNIRRIVGIPNTTMCSLTETAPLTERVRSAIEFPWSCAPLT